MRAAAKAILVFATGTVQWAWGLDNTNAWGNANTDPNPRLQFLAIERLGDIIVGPRIEGSDDVGFGHPRCKHDQVRRFRKA